MEQLTNLNADITYQYRRYNFNELNVLKLRAIINSYTKQHSPRRHGDSARKNRNGVVCKSKLVGKSNKYGKCFLDIPLSFDIETTTLQDKEVAYMYIWQVGLCDNVIIGREWVEFERLLLMLKQAIKPLKNQRVICWIANLGYEFQFIRKRLNVTDSFLKEQRKPCYIEHDTWLIFQDALLMTNTNLAKLAKDYTNTQKCVNDLDYDTIRTKKTQLTATELSYVDNDVLILTEWARYYYDTYIINGYKPITITGVLERIIKDSYKASGLNIEGTKPQDEDEYKFIMTWLYRGGYTHANELYVDIDFNDPLNDMLASFDFTSSYPSIMTLQCCFPCVWRLVLGKLSFARMVALGQKYCTQAVYTFHNIRATTDQTIESKHKCIELEGAVLDNGRIRKASKMTVALCDLDVLNYIDFYAWDSCDVATAKYAKRRYLDNYFVKPMLNDYVAKDILKKQGLPYAKEKARCNSAYGLSVKRLNSNITHYNNEGWSSEDAQSYEKQMRDKPFSPYVGIYVSACARRNLLATVKQLESINKPVLYCDTDSIKILHHDEQSQQIIDNYNNKIAVLIQLASKRYNVPVESIHDLGMFDREHAEGITRFKCLGAKRYLISYLENGKEKHDQTIAGLPKNILFKRYTPNEVYDMFEDDLTVNECKLLSKYIDEPTTVTVDGVTHEELSSIALIKSDFTMSIDDVWTMLFLQYQKENNREKWRI